MTDEIDISKINAIVEFDEAAEFFAQRTTKGCPICGYTKWTLFSSSGTEDSRYSFGVPGVSLPSRNAMASAMPVILAICMKCAFVRMHSAVDIAKWVADGKPEFVHAE
jgi:hypothetical protein